MSEVLVPREVDEWRGRLHSLISFPKSHEPGRTLHHEADLLCDMALAAALRQPEPQPSMWSDDVLTCMAWEMCLPLDAISFNKNEDGTPNLQGPMRLGLEQAIALLKRALAKAPKREPQPSDEALIERLESVLLMCSAGQIHSRANYPNLEGDFSAIGQQVELVRDRLRELAKGRT